MGVVTRIVVPERMLFCEGMGVLEAVYGRVSRDAVLYAVQRYFGSEHGWSINGFDSRSSAMNTEGVSSQRAKVLGEQLSGFVELAL